MEIYHVSVENRTCYVISRMIMIIRIINRCHSRQCCQAARDVNDFVASRSAPIRRTGASCGSKLGKFWFFTPCRRLAARSLSWLVWCFISPSVGNARHCQLFFGRSIHSANSRAPPPRTQVAWASG
jgi:hypothetical protein